MCIVYWMNLKRLWDGDGMTTLYLTWLLMRFKLWILHIKLRLTIYVRKCEKLQKVQDNDVWSKYSIAILGWNHFRVKSKWTHQQTFLHDSTKKYPFHIYMHTPPLPLFPPLFCGMIICLPLNLKIDTYAPSIGFTYESRQCPMISSALFSVGFVLKLNYIEASS